MVGIVRYYFFKRCKHAINYDYFEIILKFGICYVSNFLFVYYLVIIILYNLIRLVGHIRFMVLSTDNGASILKIKYGYVCGYI